MSLDSFIAAAQNSQDLQQLEQQYGVCVPLPPFAMRAGPRDEIYFDPKAVTAAVVSTGEGKGGCAWSCCPTLQVTAAPVSMFKHRERQAVTDSSLLWAEVSQHFAVRYSHKWVRATAERPWTGN